MIPGLKRDEERNWTGEMLSLFGHLSTVWRKE